MGLDLEMAIHDHYFEVLDVIESLFQYIFDGLRVKYGAWGGREGTCSKTSLMG